MAVRNFWIAADIDGRKTELHGGPVRKDGGFDLTIKIRDAGSIRTAAYILGRADEDGGLTLTIDPQMSGAAVFEGGTFQARDGRITITARR